ncbi:MAG: hypothetical protein VW268_14095 [Rhodospirillaceae bacterium]
MAASRARAGGFAITDEFEVLDGIVIRAEFCGNFCGPGYPNDNPDGTHETVEEKVRYLKSLPVLQSKHRKDDINVLC